MTTTAYDCDNLFFASDTRWSANLTLMDGEYILLVDDTGFNKLASRPGGTIICAGDGKTIEQLKLWWMAEPFEPDNLPDLVEGDSFKVSVMVVSAHGERLFDAGRKQVVFNPETSHMHAIFSGSGSSFAANTFMQCGCAKSAVEMAKLFDPYSGGDVKFCNIKTGDSNLQDETMSYNSIMQSMIDKGVLMKFAGFYAANSENVSTIPLRDHPQSAQLINQLHSGSIRAYAPMGGADIDWNEDRLSKLKEAARKVARIEQEMAE
ncbi:hypothetical protein ACNGYR_002135 [Serratia marcescens]|uniref:hypothetical protein n=1 Tax=Serratia marcescens TaxID=615 RepID=UPI000EFB6E2D|nr:hypothetical protein [Serratia marcescens]MBH2737419.1 hypothetical protein [Serratia marcescens]BEN27038.1 hypothetical protein SMKC032_31330 [Serratia marcescens]